MINMFDFESQMVRIIPSFAGFTEFTTSIPKIYFDVKSQEQRILGICKLLGKVICYADMLGEKTDEIVKVLKDIEDGKLDDIITAAVAEWFEEHEEQIYSDIVDLQQRVGAIETELAQSGMHNEPANIEKVARFANNRTDMVIEGSTPITAEDIEQFTYAGKNVYEIFDLSKPWALFIMDDLEGNFPRINGILPETSGQCYYDSETNTLSFNSWEQYAESGSYLRYRNIPVVNGHTYAVFGCCEFEHYRRGEFGFETTQVACTSAAEGIKQIFGHNVAAANTTMGIVIGNLPRNTGLFIYERANMYTVLHNMCVIDLDLLFADGTPDDYAGFADAYYMFMASKNLSETKYKSQFVIRNKAELSDIEAYDTFIAHMNDYAHDMLMENTVYKTASGYPSFPGATASSSEYNTLTCPLDSLKILLACSNVPFLKNTMASAYHNVAISRGFWNTDITVPNNIVSSEQGLNYMRIYGKSGQLSNALTGSLAPYGVVNNVSACSLAYGHTGYIALLNTPYNDGSGLPYNSILSYYNWIQRALNQIIEGTDPEEVVYDENLQAAMEFEDQPTSFAAFIAPEGFDSASVIAMSYGRFRAWIREAKLYLGNNDGSQDTDTQVAAASVTKLMTAYIAAIECDLDELIELHSTDYIGGSGMLQLQSPDRANKAVMKMRDAITAMMYYSDNTIATAIARHIGCKIAGNVYNGSSLMQIK